MAVPRALRTAFAGIGVAAAACTVPGIGTTEPKAGPCKAYRACTVVTAADVTAATGTTFQPGVENDVSASPGASAASSVTCVYDTGKTTNPFLRVLVRCCGCGDNDPPAAQQAFAGSGMTVTYVSGVGDVALWVETNADAGVPIIDQLIVFVGADLQVIVSIAVPLGQMFSFDPLAAAMRIAGAALPRL
jgi:hypothetical protein